MSGLEPVASLSGVIFVCIFFRIDFQISDSRSRDSAFYPLGIFSQMNELTYSLMILLIGEMVVVVVASLHFSLVWATVGAG